MATMSTPINQLPTNVSNEVIQENIHQLEDISIANVINEMEKQVLQQQPQYDQQTNMNMNMNSHMNQNPHANQNSHANQNPNSGERGDVIRYPSQMPQQGQFQNFPQVQHVFHQQYPTSPEQGPKKIINGYKNIQWLGLIDISYAQRAVIAAIVAAIIFYPFETGIFYEKIPFLSNMHQHDRMIRTLILAVILYLLLLKINI
jgi:hypothetical protein